jgi:hypothetical protein
MDSPKPRRPGRALYLCALLAIPAFSARAQSPAVSISGALEWDKMEISAQVSLNFKSAGLRFPTGRTRGEELIAAEYLALMRPLILSIPLDSSSTAGDHLAGGDFSLFKTESYALSARATPPAMSADLETMRAAYAIRLEGLSAEFNKSRRPASPRRVLSALPAAAYTGIIIVAGGELPLHGTGRRARVLPCLFPKIWDSDMNIVYDKTIQADPGSLMVHYAQEDSIFQNNPSGLSPELRALVGDRPLRILARGVYGIRPTDPVIDTEDALTIFSSEENRGLLREGRVVIILDRDLLKTEF